MTKYIQGKDGKFAGSIPDGGHNVPTPADLPRAPAPTGSSDVENAVASVEAAHEAYMRHTRTNREYPADIPEPDLRGAYTITHPQDKPHMVENYRDDDVWFCTTQDEAKDLAARVMASDPYLSGWVGWE